jgi:hypothetical protein
MKSIRSKTAWASAIILSASLALTTACQPQLISSSDINLANLGVLGVSLLHTSGSASTTATAVILLSTDIGAGRDLFEVPDHIILEDGEQILVDGTTLQLAVDTYLATVQSVTPPAAHEISFSDADGTTSTGSITPPADFEVSLENDTASIADGLTVTWTESEGGDSDVSVTITILRSGNFLFTRAALGDTGTFTVSGSDLEPINNQVPDLAEGQTIRIEVARRREVEATLDGLSRAVFRSRVRADTTAELGA